MMRSHQRPFIIQLNLTDIKNTEVCFAAYRKQEFTAVKY